MCVCMLGTASVPELDSMWQKLANNPQVLQHMFSLPYTKTVLEGFEASPDVAQQVSFSLLTIVVITITIRPQSHRKDQSGTGQ